MEKSRRHQKSFLVFLLLLVGTHLEAWDYSLGPRIIVPVGESWELFEPGTGQALGASFPIEDTNWTLLGDFEALGVDDKSQRSVLAFSAGPGVAYELPLADAWSADVRLKVSGLVASRGNFTLATPTLAVAAGSSVSVRLAPTLAFRLGFEYYHVVALIQGVSAWAHFEVSGGGPP